MVECRFVAPQIWVQVHYPGRLNIDVTNADYSIVLASFIVFCA